MRPYHIYDVGNVYPSWQIEDCPGSIAFSTRENYIFRGPPDIDDLLATIEKGKKHRWKITLLESGITIDLHIIDERKCEFEYRDCKYIWQRQEERNWDLMDEEGVLVAQFDKVRMAVTKVGRLYVTGKGKWLEHEIVVATIKAAETYSHERIN